MQYEYNCGVIPTHKGKKRKGNSLNTAICLLSWASGVKNESFFLITVLQTFWTHGLIFKMKNMYKVKKQTLVMMC